eukprot:scaffold5885_cov201-Amphora_coffeaeformis.AAC.14
MPAHTIGIRRPCPLDNLFRGWIGLGGFDFGLVLNHHFTAGGYHINEKPFPFGTCAKASHFVWALLIMASRNLISHSDSQM